MSPLGAFLEREGKFSNQTKQIIHFSNPFNIPFSSLYLPILSFAPVPSHRRPVTFLPQSYTGYVKSAPFKKRGIFQGKRANKGILCTQSERARGEQRENLYTFSNPGQWEGAWGGTILQSFLPWRECVGAFWLSERLLPIILKIYRWFRRKSLATINDCHKEDGDFSSIVCWASRMRFVNGSDLV